MNTDIRMSRGRKIFFFVVTFCIISIFVLTVTKVSLRLFFSRRRHCVHPPNITILRNTIKGTLPGIEGETKFTTNSYGLRGPELPRDRTDKDYVILFVGGSSTECAYLDDKDAWPNLVMENLNAAVKRHNVIAQNAGRAPHSTRNHIVLLNYLLPVIRPSCVIILCGGNELKLISIADPDFTHNSQKLERTRKETFWNLEYQTSPEIPFYKKTIIWQALRKAAFSYSHRMMVEDKKGKCYIDRRKAYQEGRKVKIFNSEGIVDRINRGLLEYRRNIKEIINICKRNKVRPIFITQPTLLRKGLPENYRRLLWLGQIAENVYGDEEDLEKLLGMYNEALKEICVQNDVEYIDLANDINKDMDNFYDDGHFNRKGSHKVAAVVTDYLRTRLP